LSNKRNPHLYSTSCENIAIFVKIKRQLIELRNRRKSMNHLYCYKMTWDTEFAPNPHHGVLTLATCKPVMRRCAKVGDWISGWAAKTVHDLMGCHRFPTGKTLIYIAQITDIIPMEEYWHRFPQKRPSRIAPLESNSNSGCGKNMTPAQQTVACKKHGIGDLNTGDNIYKPLIENPDYSNPLHWEQIENRNHEKSMTLHDLSGKRVLICETFTYFGVRNAKEISTEIFGYDIPRYKKIALNDPNVVNLISHVNEYYENGIVK
jgi:hypothetical protein